MHFSDLLEVNGRKYPKKEALISASERWTYQEWNEQANHMAQVMQQKGLKRGDRVGIMMPNTPQFAIVFFAIIRAGGVAVPINARLSKDELVSILHDCEANGFIVHEQLFPVVAAIKDETSLAFYTKTGNPADGWDTINQWEQSPIGAFEGFDYHTLEEDDLTSILYTSGTTGSPKGVQFSSRNLMTVGTMFSIEMEIQHNSRLLHLMPLSHSAPLNLMFSAGLIVGASHVFAPTFTPDLLLQLTQSESITHFFGAPVAYLLTIQHPSLKDFDLSSVKQWIYGGAPLSGEQAKLLGEVFGNDKLICAYGLTEAGPSGTLLKHKEYPHKAGTVGNRGALFAEVEIVNAEDEPCASGEMGEVRIRGEGNMLGYYNRPKETAEALKDGWVYSGDIALMDEDGFVHIVDRKKDMIISGGVNISPKEIELVLETHPDITEIAVIGVPHSEWGETIKACIVPSKAIDRNEQVWLEEIKSFLNGKIADFKIPRMVEIVAELPRNANGKVLKHQLKGGSHA